jgi:5,10-methylenetetrahydrofolate reductase
VTTRDYAPLISKANARAQRRFHAMVRERAYVNPAAPETRLYTEAERALRELEAARDFAVTLAAFESRMAEMDELMEADLLDNGLPDVPVAVPWSASERGEMWGPRS